MLKDLFKKPQNELELTVSPKTKKQALVNIPDELCVTCPSCKKTIFSSDLEDNLFVCPHCDKHLRINSRQRLHFVTDELSFQELWGDLESTNRLDFPQYEKKLQAAAWESREKEGVITGTATVGSYPVAIFVMEAGFMMGSMGTIVGEKITRLFEYAMEHKLPVVGFTASGGARMQEGILSLMQMAKTSGAVKRFSDAGGFYLTVLTDPTTGGVTASFAMEGDIIISEPEALVCFAGPRVIEQTIRQKLPPGLGKAEFLLKNGFIDKIVARKEQKNFLIKMLRSHQQQTKEVQA